MTKPAGCTFPDCECQPPEIGLLQLCKIVRAAKAESDRRDAELAKSYPADHPAPGDLGTIPL